MFNKKIILNTIQFTMITTTKRVVVEINKMFCRGLRS
jgi:hypothetical protein